MRPGVARISPAVWSLPSSPVTVARRMTLTGVKKHVRVLEAAGLVTTRKAGRVRTCTLGPRRLEDETAWLAHYHAMLEARLDRLGAFLERQQEEER